MEGAEEGPDETGEAVSKTQVPEINGEKALIFIEQRIPDDISDKSTLNLPRHDVCVAIKPFVDVVTKGFVAEMQQIVFQVSDFSLHNRLFMDIFGRQIAFATPI